ncbi:MAG: GNAT family N-acetyltransferase [Flavobacteriales bacterium]|jgi:ElaA protein|nr:GNAT family N-acetyltransferase [Flavobacteriales bacterium]
MNWILKTFKELTTTELYAILKLRSEIFVVEQNCAYQDLDDKDQKAWHLFTEKDGNVLAYTRLFKSGDCYTEASIGRVVVASSQRGTGLGHKLMKESILALENRFGKTPIKIGAQTHLTKFYEPHGFIKINEEYLEDGIPHIHMLRAV